MTGGKSTFESAAAVVEAAAAGCSGLSNAGILLLDVVWAFKVVSGGQNNELCNKQKPGLPFLVQHP